MNPGGDGNAYFGDGPTAEARRKYAVGAKQHQQ
jgi:hypothetical protein